MTAPRDYLAERMAECVDAAAEAREASDHESEGEWLFLARELAAVWRAARRADESREA